MPDNVSLTVADINTFRQIQQSALNRLNIKNFTFKYPSKDPVKMSLIGDNTSGIRIYTERQTISVKKGQTSATFNFTNMNFTIVPNIVASIGGTKDLSSYNLALTVVPNTDASGCTVYVDYNKATVVEIDINLIAIGYA